MSREQSMSREEEEEEESTPPPHVPPPTPSPPPSTQPGGPPPPYSGTRGRTAWQPPTYQSLFGGEQVSIQAITETRENFDSSAIRSFQSSRWGVQVLCCLLIFSTFPVLEIIIGAIYHDRCELEENIPIFLIVLGSANLVHTVLNILKRLAIWLKGREGGRQAVRSGLYQLSSCFEALLSIFMLVWMFIGSVWVFGNYHDWESTTEYQHSDDYCHPVVYLFSFILLIVFYCLLAVGLCCCCCLCCVIFLECYLAVRSAILREMGRDEELQLVTV